MEFALYYVITAIIIGRVMHTFEMNSIPKSLDFSAHQKYATLPSGLFTRNDRPELSAGISSITTAEHSDLLLKVSNLSE